MTRSDSPRSTSHSRSVPSSLPLSTLRLSGVKARPFTTALWPSSAALFAIPQPDHVVKAATGEQAAIPAPGHAIHLLRMPHKRLQTASACEFPQLEGAIPARAGHSAAVGGKGQSPHPVAMPREYLHAASRPGLLPLPQPNRAREVATGEQASIRTPGQRIHRASVAIEGLAVHTPVGVPESD